MKRSSAKERSIAFHEAGHVVAYFRVNRKFKYVTIVPKDDSAGHVKGYRVRKDISDQYRKLPWSRFSVFVDKTIMISLAGIKAQKKGAPRSVRNWHASGDWRNIDAWLSSSNDVGWKEYVAYCHKRLDVIFGHKVTWSALVALVDALVEKKTLSYEEARKIFFEAQNRAMHALK